MIYRIVIVSFFLSLVTAPAAAQPLPGEDGFAPCRETTTLYQPGPDGPQAFYQRIFSYHYDDDGHLIRSELDGCGTFEFGGEPPMCAPDGAIDQIRYFTFDEHGRPATESWDVFADGELDVVNRFTFDENGHRLADESDLGVDGSIERRIVYQTDSAGRPTVVDFDFNGDGVADHRIVHSYDEEGREVNWEEDAGADGEVDYRLGSVYGDNGLIEVAVTDGDGDAQPDEQVAYFYEDERLVATARDLDLDGNFDIATSYQYDAQGRLILTLEDADMDHVYEAEIVWEHVCDDGVPP